jgi:hypothetical protein
MKTNRLYRDVIAEIRTETGRNVVAWAANNRGRGDCNLTVAELQPGIERTTTSALQTGVITMGTTSHWRGCVTRNKIFAVIGGGH